METAYNNPVEKYDKELTQLYEKYVHEFIAKHIKYGEADCFDAYGEAVLAIYEGIKTGKTRKGNPFEVKKDLKNLLFVSAKKRLLTILQKRSGKRKLESEYIQELALEIDEAKVVELDKIDANPKVEAIKRVLHKMGASCQEILRLFYFEGYDLQEIKEIKHYDNEAVVKQSLYRCREKLKEMLRND